MFLGSIKPGVRVKLNKPYYSPPGSSKKFFVWVRDPVDGRIRKVRFGQRGVRIKRSDPVRRRSFRARHRCDEALDVLSPRYWSCKMW